jgi:hypothetical protein
MLRVAMSVRNWTVGVAAAAAVMGGVAAVQSGITGMGALPSPTTRDYVPPAPGLPAPGEVAVPPPSAGTVRDAPATRVVAPARTQTRAAVAVHRPGKEKSDDSHSGKGKEKSEGDKSDDGGKGNSGKD